MNRTIDDLICAYASGVPEKTGHKLATIRHKFLCHNASIGFASLCSASATIPPTSTNIVRFANDSLPITFRIPDWVIAISEKASDGGGKVAGVDIVASNGVILFMSKPGIIYSVCEDPAASSGLPDL